MRIYEVVTTEDKATSKNYKYLHLILVNNSLFAFFSFKAIAIFSHSFISIFLN